MEAVDEQPRQRVGACGARVGRGAEEDSAQSASSRTRTCRLCHHRTTSISSGLGGPPVTSDTVDAGLPHLESSPAGAASRSLDHHATTFGTVYTTVPSHHQVKGALNHPKSLTLKPLEADTIHDDPAIKIHPKPMHNPTMPDLPFPKFDGTNPKLWLTNCETFFDVYDVHPKLWI